MRSRPHHLDVEAACPACPEMFVVPFDVIEESRRLLAEHGPCVGMASYECPAPYFAALEPAARPAATPLAHDLARWEDDGGAPAGPRARGRAR